MIGDDLLDLGGQVALVTGAGQGAGRATALELARHNAGGIAVNDFVAERAEAVVRGNPARWGSRRWRCLSTSATLRRSARAAARIEAEIGAPATILVNNAGMAGPGGTFDLRKTFWEEDPAMWDKYLRTNLYGVFNCCHAIIPAMVAAKRGRIVTIVSDSGRVGEPRMAVYAAAKAGANGFVRSIAKEVGRYNITCNAVSLSALMPDMPEEKLARDHASDHGQGSAVALHHPPLRQIGRCRRAGHFPVLGRRIVDHRPDLSAQRRLCDGLGSRWRCAWPSTSSG